MFKIINILFIMLVATVSCSDGSEKVIVPPKDTTNVPGKEVAAHARGKEMFDLIINKYKISNTNFFSESYPPQPVDPAYAYLWSHVATTNAAATIKQLGYSMDYTGIVNTYEKYFSSGRNNNIGGYNSASDGSAGKGTRFYDDNSIVGISLIEAFHITNNSEYIQKAKRIVTFLQSGIDTKFGGGLWWNEDEKNMEGNANSNKPACANGYAVLFLMQYYEVCDPSEKTQVLNMAKELYIWLRTNLYDGSTKCYWNDKNASGNINYTIWTYNTGVMIQNGIRLYKATGDQKYIDEAKESASGSYDYFIKVRNGVLSFPDHDPWFNTKLLRAYIDIAPYFKPAENYINTYFNFINYAYDHSRTAEGLFYEDWTGSSQKRYYLLLMQAAVVESYGAIALYRNEDITKD